MKLALRGFGLAVLGGWLLYLGFAEQYRFGVAIVAGSVLIYAGAVIVYGELRRLYYRHQKERQCRSCSSNE